ncbi:MAG: hypothetical protein WCP39_00800 [Chlamydiota bacterium]
MVEPISQISNSLQNPITKASSTLLIGTTLYDLTTLWIWQIAQESKKEREEEKKHRAENKA